MSHPDVFAARLRHARLAARLSVRALAQRVGVSHVCIIYLERGRNGPGLKVAANLAVALRVSLDWLAGLTGDAPCVTSTT